MISVADIKGVLVDITRSVNCESLRCGLAVYTTDSKKVKTAPKKRRPKKINWFRTGGRWFRKLKSKNGNASAAVC